MCSGFSSDPFCGQKNRVRDATLERAERRAVNVMDDYRNPGAAGRKTAKNTGFAAVRMDNIGPLLAQRPTQCAPGAEVLPGMHRPHQIRNNGEQFGACRKRWLQG